MGIKEKALKLKSRVRGVEKALGTDLERIIKIIPQEQSS